jgi:hypothetical protein
MFKKYESVPKTCLFDKSLLAALMSARKYDVIHQTGDCSLVSRESVINTQRHCRTPYGKDSPSDNVIPRS